VQCSSGERTTAVHVSTIGGRVYWVNTTSASRLPMAAALRYSSTAPGPSTSVPEQPERFKLNHLAAELQSPTRPQEQRFWVDDMVKPRSASAVCASGHPRLRSPSWTSEEPPAGWASWVAS